MSAHLHRKTRSIVQTPRSLNQLTFTDSQNDSTHQISSFTQLPRLNTPQTCDQKTIPGLRKSLPHLPTRTDKDGWNLKHEELTQAYQREQIVSKPKNYSIYEEITEKLKQASQFHKRKFNLATDHTTAENFVKVRKVSRLRESLWKSGSSKAMEPPESIKQKNQKALEEISAKAPSIGLSRNFIFKETNPNAKVYLISKNVRFSE